MSTLFIFIAKRLSLLGFFFFNDTATTEIYTLSLHDALPISAASEVAPTTPCSARSAASCSWPSRSEEHTSELQSHLNLVCRLLLEKKKGRGARTAGADLAALRLQRPQRHRVVRAHRPRPRARAAARLRRLFFFLMIRPPPRYTLFPYTTLFRSGCRPHRESAAHVPPRSRRCRCRWSSR